MSIFPKYFLKTVICAVLCALWSIHAARADSGFIYSQHQLTGEIRRAALEAASAETLIGAANVPSYTSAQSFAIDPINGKIYWTQATPNLLARANLNDGSGYQLLSAISSRPGSIALDPAHDRLFFALPSQGIIVRANLNGSNQTPIIAKQGSPDHLHLDVPNQHVYWSDMSLRKIRRANFDGTNVIDIVNIGMNEQPSGMVLDLFNSRIYWSEIVGGTIKVANLNQPLPANSAIYLGSLLFPGQLALDLGAQQPKLYFLARPAGSDLTSAFFSPLSKPGSLGAVPSNEPRSKFALDLPCGSFSSDSDGDGAADCQDGCVSDPNKIAPQICGCGLPDTDSDNDSIVDCLDACPHTPSIILPNASPFCPNGPVLSPSTVLSEAPKVRIKGRNAIVTMQGFAAVTDNLNINQAARRLVVKYDVRLKSKNVLTSQVRAQTVKRNKLVYRNLAPGTYSVKYRALIGRGKRTVSRTKFSPAARFTIH